MSTRSDLLGGVAPPVTFEHAGKTYAVGAVNERAKAAVERWLRAAAFSALYELRDTMPADQYAGALSSLARSHRAFAYGGKAYYEAMETDEGAVMLTCILFACPRGEAETLLRERGAEVNTLLVEAAIAAMPEEQAKAVRAKMEAQASAAGGGAGEPPANPR